MIKTKASITSMDEDRRQSQRQVAKSYFNESSKYGTIKEVHPTLYAVTVELTEGGLAANGTFLAISNPWQQLIHDFGNLRPGLLVELTNYGEQEQFAQARVIGLEGETIGGRTEAPEVNLSLYEIFSPGF
jgi:hypothetical protein